MQFKHSPMETHFISIASIITAFGGFEIVKYLLNRRTNKRIARSQAQSEEFAALRDIIVFLQDQLRDEISRHKEQTALVRSLNSEIVGITREKTQAATELAIKRCERRGCPKREPQNNY